MAQPRIVFEPYASGAQRNIVEEIVNRRNIALTGHDQWYPVAFFVKTDAGEILGGLLGTIWAERCTYPPMTSLCRLPLRLNASFSTCLG
jgi:hypothetical protein